MCLLIVGPRSRSFPQPLSTTPLPCLGHLGLMENGRGLKAKAVHVGTVKSSGCGIICHMGACVLSHLSHVQLFVAPVDCSQPGFSVHGIS